MPFKIRDGTAPDDAPSLCLSCRHATIVRGARINDEIVHCGMLSSGCLVVFVVVFLDVVVMRQLFVPPDEVRPLACLGERLLPRMF